MANGTTISLLYPSARDLSEALGNSSDILTAYREGKFAPSQKPRLGWIMLLAETPRSTTPVRIDEPDFDVFPEFRESLHVDCYRIFCERLIRERLYDAACPLLSDLKAGKAGKFREPGNETDFAAFADSLLIMRSPSRGAGHAPDQTRAPRSSCSTPKSGPSAPVDSS